MQIERRTKLLALFFTLTLKFLHTYEQGFCRRRVEKFRHAQPGDKVYYSQDFTHTESFLLFFSHSTGYSMAVVCFVEQNVNNGERLQIRVGSVKSSNSNYYSTPVIDGMEYHKGDVLWIKPLNDKRWQIE